MTLAEFLLARIAEDEERFAVEDDEVAAALRPAPNPMWQGDDGYIVLLHARMLAECEAKRRIVGRSHVLSRNGQERVVVGGMEWVLSLLALPYADHPDYRQEWKP